MHCRKDMEANLETNKTEGQHFYSPKGDIMFKLLFADGKNTETLAAFQKSVLSLPVEDYVDIEIMNPYLDRAHLKDKLAIMDVSIMLKSGKRIDVEVQLLPTKDFISRMLYYPAKLITSQVSKGESYLEIKQVISVIICDFVLVFGSDSYHNRFTLYDPVHGVEFSDLLEINTLELPKLPKEKDGTELWSWLRFIDTQNLEELEFLVERSPQMREAVTHLMELTDKERDWWNEYYRERAELDEKYREWYIRDEARAEGLAEKAASVARNLLQMQMPIDEIAAVTDLSVDEINSLK